VRFCSFESRTTMAADGAAAMGEGQCFATGRHPPPQHASTLQQTPRTPRGSAPVAATPVGTPVSQHHSCLINLLPCRQSRVVKQQMSRGGSARAGPSKYYRDFNDSAGLAVEDDYGQGHAQTVPTTSSTRISNPRCEMGIP